MPFPTDPLIHRSVYTRGFMSPSPWAQRATTLLMDTLVTFTRRSALVDAGAGTFRPAGLAEAVVWAPWAHVELDDIEGGTALARGMVDTDGIGPLSRRRFIVITALPPTPELMPLRDDYLAFTDATGNPIHAKVDKVDIPQNLPDHLEITSEWFE